LLIVQLARQSIDGNVVLSAELAPQNKAQIVLSGGIGDRIIYGRRLILWLAPQHDLFALLLELEAV
jgi:hypothetical protein